MSAFSRGLAAFACEALAIALILRLEDPAALAGYFAVHAVASLLIATALLPLLPAGQVDRPRAALLFLFCVSFFLPAAGMIGMLTMAIMARVASVRGTRRRFDLHPDPIYDPRGGEVAAVRASGGVRVQLANTSVPAEARLRALLTVQSMPARMANPLIREMLSDPSEDLRLIAYGILDTREKTINARIHAATLRLAQAGEHERASLHKQLAELYCELIYQGLVHGVLREHAAAQARAHVDRAMAIDSRDAALHGRSGQIALSSRDYRTAELALQRALELGLPESRVLPYLAEVAFRTRRFGEVRSLVRRLARLASTPRIDHVIAYWRMA
jgi:hypothetical protein